MLQYWVPVVWLAGEEVLVFPDGMEHKELLK